MPDDEIERLQQLEPRVVVAAHCVTVILVPEADRSLTDEFEQRGILEKESPVGQAAARRIVREILKARAKRLEYLGDVVPAAATMKGIANSASLVAAAAA